MPLPAANAAMFLVFLSLGTNVKCPFGGATSIVSPAFKTLFA